MEGSARTISFDLGPRNRCIKTGGDTSTECTFAYGDEDAGSPQTKSELTRRATATFRLDADDQAYLGSLDFEFDFSCGPGVFPSYGSPAWSTKEIFTTRECAE
jgi:hypothetical protein